MLLLRGTINSHNWHRDSPAFEARVVHRTHAWGGGRMDRSLFCSTALIVVLACCNNRIFIVPTSFGKLRKHVRPTKHSTSLVSHEEYDYSTIITRYAVAEEFHELLV